MALSDEELKMITQRCDAATRGPWKAYIEGRDHTSGDTFILQGVGPQARDLYLSVSKREGAGLEAASDADHDFIANARQDIPRLLEEIERLQGRSS